MLTIHKTVTLKGSTELEGKAIESYQASVDSRNPEGISFSVWQNDVSACKLNRQECRKNYADFQDAAYDLQDQMVEEATEEIVAEEVVTE